MQKRRELIFALKPKSQSPMALRLTFGTGAIRQIDVVYVEGLEFDGNDKSGFYHRTAIVLRAHNQVWYDPSKRVIQLGGSDISAYREVPTSIPLRIGIAGFNQVVNVTYAGTYDSFPVIRLFGPMDRFYIQELTTGDYIELTVPIDDGDIVTIDTNYGMKTITDQDGTNLIQYYTGDIATFRILATEVETTLHGNSYRVEADNTSSNSKVFFEYYNRYIGV